MSKSEPATVSENTPQVLFLVRKNPGGIGGVQRHSARLIEGLSRSFHIEKATWTGPEWAAPLYFSSFYRKAERSKAGVVHCDDAVTSLVGARIRSGTGKKAVATVHGLDIIMPIAWYQRRVCQALQEIDRVVCVSRATAEEVRNRGVTPEKITVIHNAAETVKSLPPKDENLYAAIERLTGISLGGRRVLLSLGRPVRRKGFDGFIANVFPHLSEDCVYIVAGPAPKSPSWMKAARPFLGKKLFHNLRLASGCDTIHKDLIRLSRHPRVFYLNGVSEELRNLLFAASDLFIVPNRRVSGDMEGFGIVALEASVRGVPVIATGIEGITDAVINGQNGFCVSEGDHRGMISVIDSLLRDRERLSFLGKKAAEFTSKAYSLELITSQYARIFRELGCQET